MFIFVLSLLCATSAASAELGRSLRGAEDDTRWLQAVPDAEPRVGVPQCGPGYRDVTAGNAYYPWSCAATCEGGRWFATSDCFCACVRVEQSYEPTIPPSGISVTSNPGTTQGPRTTLGYVPVRATPAPPSYVASPQPSTTPGFAAPEVPESPETVEGGDFPLAAAAAVVSGLLVCGAITCIWVGVAVSKNESPVVSSLDSIFYKVAQQLS